jgi:pimeloyl-ACP methyl ester carboxylesterase
VPPRSDSTVTLPDGRRLAYAEWGDPDGKPVFFFHGSPGSRLFCPDEPASVAAGVRLITVDRPGVGRSDTLVARTWGDWPADVVGLADALGIGRFAVVGWSYGGNYAAACAALIPSRLTAVGAISTRHLSEYNFVERPGAYEELDPDERADYDVAKADPIAAAENWVRRNVEWVANLQKNPESFLDPAKLPAPDDKWFFDDENRRRELFAGMSEAVRQGTDGFRWEMIDGLLPWGFRLNEIRMRVHLWYGELDERIARRHVDFIAGQIRDCVLVVWPDAGHFGIAKHWGQILGELLPG